MHLSLTSSARSLLIKKTILADAATVLALTGLNLVPGKVYEIACMMSFNAAVADTVDIMFNADNTALHYWSHGIYRKFGTGANSIISVAINDDLHNDNNSTADIFTCLFYRMIMTGTKAYLSRTHHSWEGAEMEWGGITLLYDPGAALAQINAITLTAAIANSIKAGSWLAAYEVG